MPESPANDAKQAASAAKGTASAVKGAATTVKAVATVAKAGSGPAGWIMLAKQYGRQIQDLVSRYRKVAAAAAAIAAAYLLYLLWLLLQKILGIIAGLAFGAVTGLPLFLIPGAGPFLYGGWVSYWGYRGLTDPAGTIQLATHPWEAITKPVSWVSDKLTGFGSTTKGGVEYVGGGVSQGVSGAISGVGNFVAGAASGIWNAAVGAVGNAIGWGSSLLSGGFNLLSTGATAATATVAKVAVGGAIGTITTVSIVSSITTNTAFSTPDGGIEEDGTSTGPPSNELFTVTKTVDQPTIGNLGGGVVFTITVVAKKNLTAITITDVLTRKSGTTNPPVNCPLPFNAPSVCTQTIPLSVDNTDSDSVINNSVTVNATADDGTTATGSASASVTVGSAPTEGCFNFSGPWAQSEIDIERQAIARISQSTTYINLLCASGTINIVREPGGGYNHAACPNNVYISNNGIGSLNQTSFTLAHETGHIVQTCTHPEIYQGYLNQAPYISEGFICSYPYSAILGSDQSTWPSESFAEMIGIYVAWRNFPTDLCGQINYPTQYPAHYNFAKNNLYGGTEF